MDKDKLIKKLRHENKILKESLEIACNKELVKQLIKSVKSFKKKK